ncbi:hypothetical protein ACIQUW_15080 [Streptomyces sp. NPDC101117]|uniref:hypothetical protein n=1 Tax=Streptomyces sp. NPDC101117 TaxID=3366108 RepID=UPI0038085D5C
MTESYVDAAVAARIAAARAKREREAVQRAELSEARQAGLEARKRAKSRRLYCATCARRQWRGTFYRCPLGCGAAVCRKYAHCGNTHLKQCDNRAEAS